MILSNFEKTGQWSTSEQGQDFIVNVANETGTNIFSIGKSYLNNEIYGLEMGSGSRLIIITGGVHRAEPASREMVMIKARDMAYDVGGKYANYLSNHRVLIIPTVSPDVTTRLNAQGLNINRDAYYLETPEMVALMSFIADEKPDVYIDFHERSGGSLQQVEFIDPSKLDPNADNLVKSSSANMELFTRARLEALGYATAPYPQNSIGPGKTVSASAILGSVTMTPETYIDNNINEFRVSALGETFESLLLWHSSNHTIFEEIKNRFANEIIKAGELFTLLNGNNEYYNHSTKEIITLPEGYLLQNPLAFSKWKDVYNIHMDENGFVPINQPSGKLLPHLLDPLSKMAVVTASRVEPIETEPDRRKDGRYAYFLYDNWREVFVKNYLSRN